MDVARHVEELLRRPVESQWGGQQSWPLTFQFTTSSDKCTSRLTAHVNTSHKWIPFDLFFTCRSPKCQTMVVKCLWKAKLCCWSLSHALPTYFYFSNILQALLLYQLISTVEYLGFFVFFCKWLMVSVLPELSLWHHHHHHQRFSWSVCGYGVIHFIWPIDLRC